MSADIYNAVFNIIVGKIAAVLAAEAELENVHSGIACCLEHSLNLIGKEAKVLRYQLNIAKICLYCTEKLH